MGCRKNRSMELGSFKMEVPLQTLIEHLTLSTTPLIRGSFHKFCILYVFDLKMNLFYKIHLQAFNVISIVLYHSGPTFGQVLYSCLDANEGVQTGIQDIQYAELLK
jgi:hypothetical protein